MVTTVDRVQWPVVTSRENRLAQFGIGLRNRSAKAPATTVLRNRLTVFMVTTADSHRPEEQVPTLNRLIATRFVHKRQFCCTAVATDYTTHYTK